MVCALLQCSIRQKCKFGLYLNCSISNAYINICRHIVGQISIILLYILICIQIRQKVQNELITSAVEFCQFSLLYVSERRTLVENEIN